MIRRFLACGCVLVLLGCAASPTGPTIDAQEQLAPTTQPAEQVMPIATGQVAANLVAQLRSQVDAELTGIKYNRTVDHAMDGGQLLVLLSVIWCSHRRGMMRIKNDAKRAGT